MAFVARQSGKLRGTNIPHNLALPGLSAVLLLLLHAIVMAGDAHTTESFSDGTLALAQHRASADASPDRGGPLSPEPERCGFWDCAKFESCETVQILTVPQPSGSARCPLAIWAKARPEVDQSDHAPSGLHGLVLPPPLDTRLALLQVYLI